MRIRIFLLAILLCLTYSCEYKERLQMNEAESLLCVRPDSALAILDRIDSISLRLPSNIARHALLLSEARDKNYIDTKSITTIDRAVSYYSNHGTVRERMLAWYYHGIVLKNAQNYIPSILSFEKAEKEAQLLGDDLYLGLIYRNKASIHSATNNNHAAVENRRRAVDFFSKAGAENHKDYAELALAVDYSNQKNYLKADSLLNGLVLRSEDPVLVAQCRIRKAAVLVKQNHDPQSAIDYYRDSPHSYWSILDYAYFAEAFEMLNYHDSADFWLNQGYMRCVDQADSASIDYLKSRVELRRSHYETAFHLIDHAVSVQDSLTRTLLQQSVSSAQRDYYKNETQLKETEIQSMEERVAFIIALGLLLLSICVLTVISYSRSKERQLQDQMARLTLEERELERVNRDNAHLVGSLFSEKIDHLDRLCDLYFKSENGKQRESVLKQVKELAARIRGDHLLFASLEKDLDRYCYGIMTKLRVQVPKIKGENLRTIMLFFAGFSYNTVYIILNKKSIESLKTARSRYRKEIKDAHAPDTDLFLRMLEVKKQPQADTNETVKSAKSSACDCHKSNQRR